MNQTDYRDIFCEPVIGKITQGSIFNGAISRSYHGFKNVFGIVISPRCDIVQKKAPLYYYLPVIKMSDWMQVDFPLLYVNRLENEVKNNLKSVLKENNESETILDKFSPVEVERIIKKHQPQLKKKVEDKINVWKAIETYKNGGEFMDVTHADNSNVRKMIIDELTTHKNPNYYFMEHINEGGFILLMREISRLTPDMLFKIAHGLEGTLSDKELEENDLRQLDPDELYMPLYDVKSPYIEHIMQHFIQQFNKIGIEDVPKGQSTIISNIINNKI